MIMRKFLIVLSLLVALIGDIFPLTPELSLVRPWWTSILVIYWAIYVSKSLSFVEVFSLGIIQDLLLATPFGQHSLILGLALFLALKLRNIVKVFPLWQQAVSVLMILVFIYTLDLCLSWMLLNNTVSISAFALRTLTSAVAWPLLVIFMYKYQKSWLKL